MTSQLKEKLLQITQETREKKQKQLGATTIQVLDAINQAFKNLLPKLPAELEKAARREKNSYHFMIERTSFKPAPYYLPNQDLICDLDGFKAIEVFCKQNELKFEAQYYINSSRVPYSPNRDNGTCGESFGFRIEWE